jgi:hypothetical protein
LTPIEHRLITMSASTVRSSAIEAQQRHAPSYWPAEFTF